MLLIGFLGLVAGVVVALVRANEIAERVRRLEEEVRRLGRRLEKVQTPAVEAPAPPATWSQEGDSALRLESGEERTAPPLTTLPGPRSGRSESGPRSSGTDSAPAPVRRSEDWEALVGGNWFNKLGALVLVVGLALFVAYSFTQLGPAGRVVVAYAAGLALLAGGVLLERRERYVVVSRGLMGGGWAAIYFTTWALHGIESTRLVGDPRLASGLLGLVALGMILHSFRYRAEVVTLLAFLVGYATLAVSPESAFAAVGAIPLLVALLVVADRFGWPRLALVGVVATYGTFAVVWGTARADDTFLARHLRRELFLAVYWLLFEAFEVASAARRRPRAAVAQVLFAANAAAFTVLSVVQWAVLSLPTLDRVLGGMALAFLAGAVARAAFRPPSSFEPGEGTATRAAHGGYEGPITVVVPLAALAVLFRFEGGLDSTVALLAEAEALVLAGLLFRAPYLRTLAALFAWAPVLKLVVDDLGPFGGAAEDGLALEAGTPLALAVAAVAYVNPWLAARRGEPGRVAERGWSYMAALLLVAVLAVEVPLRFLAAAWLALALPLFEVGVRRGAPDLRYQAYAVTLLALWARVSAYVVGADELLRQYRSATLATGTVVAYAMTARLARLPAELLPAWERQGVRDAASCLGTALAAGFLFTLLPDRWVGLAWAFLALAVVEVGLRARLPVLRASGHAAAALAVVAMAALNFQDVGDDLAASHRLVSVLPAVFVFSFMGVRLWIARAAGLVDEGEASLRRAYAAVSGVLSVVLLRTELGRTMAVVGWAVFGLVLLAVGVRRDDRGLRTQSYLMALLTVGRYLTTNFAAVEPLLGLSSGLVTGAIVVAAFYASELILPRREAVPERVVESPADLVAWADDQARVGFSLLATGVLTLLVYHEASRWLLTVAWGAEGVLLLVAGFALRERVLRLSGLVLLGACALKVFLYDLRELEALPRILSFIVLGLSLIGVSFVYTRFREQIRRFI